MLWIELTKRFAPFAIALLLGLFVASFFVNVKPFAPFKVERRHEYQRNEYKNSCWKSKQMQRSLENGMQRDLRFQEGEIDFNSITPVAPDAPIVPRQRR